MGERVRGYYTLEAAEAKAARLNAGDRSGAAIVETYL
jgi:hypothetical protein